MWRVRSDESVDGGWGGSGVESGSRYIRVHVQEIVVGHLPLYYHYIQAQVSQDI